MKAVLLMALFFIAGIGLAQAPKSLLHSKLAKLIISEVKLTEATIDSVAKFMVKTSEQQLGKEDSINIIVTPAAKERGRPITLELKNIPMMTLLDYSVRLAGVSYEIGNHAIIIDAPTASDLSSSKSP